MTNEDNPTSLQYGRWKVVKKESNDFCFDAFPWKATTGGVCSDHKTKQEALQAAYDSNLRDEEQERYRVNQKKLRQDIEAKVIDNERIANKVRELYNEDFPFLNNSPRDWFAEFADILPNEQLPQWALDEWTDLTQKEPSSK